MDKVDELENDILYLQEEVKEREVKVMELLAEMGEDQKLSEDRAEQILMLQIENDSLRQVAPDQAEDMHQELKKQLVVSQKKLVQQEKQIKDVLETCQEQSQQLVEELKTEKEKVKLHTGLQQQVQSLERSNNRLIQESKVEVIEEIRQEQKKEVENKEKEVQQLRLHVAELMEHLEHSDRLSNLQEQDMVEVRSQLQQLKNENVRLQEKIDFKEHEFKDMISNLENQELKDEEENERVFDLAEQMRHGEESYCPHSRTGSMSAVEDNINYSLMEKSYQRRDNHSITVNQGKEKELQLLAIKGEKLNQEVLQLHNDLAVLQKQNSQLEE